MHVRHLASDPGPGHAEIDLHAARRPLEPHVPLAIRHAAVRLAPPVHVTHRGRILAVVVRLRQQTVVHAPDRVPLLPGQQTIGLQPPSTRCAYGSIFDPYLRSAFGLGEQSSISAYFATVPRST